MASKLRNVALATGMALGAFFGMPQTANASLYINFDQDVANVGNFGTVTPLAGGEFRGSGITFNIITLQDTSGGTLQTAYCGNDSRAQSCLLTFNSSTDTLKLVAPFGLTSDKVNPIFGSTLNMDVLIATSLSAPSLTSGVVFNTLGFTGEDIKSDVLLSYFAVVATDLHFGATVVYFKNPSIRVNNVSNADLSNFGNINRIPEPATLTLFGFGLIAAGRRFRRR